jgi:hypothetical protein
MKPVHVLLLVVVLALLGTIVAVTWQPATPEALAGPAPAAARPRTEKQDAPDVELVAPEEALVTAAKPAPPPAAPPAVDDMASPGGVDRTLAGAVDWLRRVMPERFGELTLAQAAALEELDLRGVALTDADLARLAAFPNLKVLGLRGTAITDAGLAHLGRIPLTSLDLRGTAVTGSSMHALPTGTLTALHLTDTKVTAAELARMPVMPQLATLKLNRLQLADDAIEALNVYPALRHLELDGTRLTDDGLERLLELQPGLVRIEARETALSAAAIEAARRDHPALVIVNQ